MNVEHNALSRTWFEIRDVPCCIYKTIIYESCIYHLYKYIHMHNIDCFKVLEDTANIVT